MKTAEQGKDYQYTTGEKDIFEIENIVHGAVKIVYQDESTQVLNLDTINQKLNDGEIELYYEIVDEKEDEKEEEPNQEEETEVQDSSEPLPTEPATGERPYRALPYSRLVENLERYRESLASEITEEGKESIVTRMNKLEEEIALRPDK